MRYHFTLLLLLSQFTPIFVIAQTSSTSESQRAASTMHGFSNPGATGVLLTLPMPPKELIGDYYLNTNWNYGSISLYHSNDLIKGYLVRLDLQRNEFEIKVKEGIKILSGEKVKSFNWQDSITKKNIFFVNIKDYKNDTEIKTSGFLEVISDGALPLLKKTDVAIKEAHYVKEYDIGSRNDEILKKESYLYALENRLFQLPKGSKKFLTIFGEKAEKVSSFISTNELSVKQTHHLKIIFDYYNSLIRS